MYAALHADRCSHMYSLRRYLIARGQGHVKHILGDFSGGGACRRDTAPCPLQPAIRVDQKLVCCWRFGTGEKRLYPGIRRYRDRLGVIRRGRLEIDPAHARWQAWKAPSPCGRGGGWGAVALDHFVADPPPLAGGGWGAVALDHFVADPPPLAGGGWGRGSERGAPFPPTQPLPQGGRSPSRLARLALALSPARILTPVLILPATPEFGDIANACTTGLRRGHVLV